MPEVKEKVVPPSPPLHIRDNEGRAVYMRVGFLGEGGFARVYEVKDQQSHHRAVKVISKLSVRSKKNKTKLWAEIKLHQMLSHPNIVRFDDCFEDEENVYMVLELCENGSMMDLLKRRKRYSEAETRFYLVQLVGACGYMHQTNIIHRDLKLGNLFFDGQMNLKVGDLGLAALIENPGDRKKTICGTPNYIAPEVLFDAANGHSFEVDIWSVGVIIYTMLVGRPPFQTKDVKAIYKRIKENRYEFPTDKPISPAAQNLITAILNPNPDERPSVETILHHPFFTNGAFPDRIPLSAHDAEPSFRHISDSASRQNFKQACKNARVGVAISAFLDQTTKRTALGPSIVKQEQDFQNAVQPGSPISALLHSAKQPLVRAPNAIREPALMRKLAAAGAQATLSPVRKAMNGKENAEAGPSRGRRRMEPVGEEEEEEEEEATKPKPRTEILDEALYQKARVVTGNAALFGRDRDEDHNDRDNMEAGADTHFGQPRKSTVQPLPPRKSVVASPPRKAMAPARVVPAPAAPRESRPAKQRTSLFESVARTLADALHMAQTPGGFYSSDVPLKPRAPKVFVVSWLDYCTKYGMGFAMADGTVCVHFNDSSSFVLAPGKQHFDAIEPSRGQGELIHGLRTNYPIEEYPRELSNKVYLMNSFESYMMDRLYGDAEYTYVDETLTTGMVFVTRYLRMRHVLLFRLSNDVLQFNYFDHTKLILSEGGLVVSFIDKYHVLRTWSLEALLAPMDADIKPREKRRVEAVLHKISYAKDVLMKYVVHGHPATEPLPTETQPKTKSRPHDLGRERGENREQVRPIR